MHSALWLLLRLKTWAWLRRLGRTMRTIKGVLIMVVVVLMFGCWFSSLLFSAFQKREGENPEVVQRVGTSLLLVYCFVTLVTTIGEKTITFNPAEIAFLFPGPFSRRQLLGYKVAGAALTLSLSALVFSLVFLRFAQTWLAGFLGAFLMLLFVQLFSMAVGLVTTTLGEGAYNRRRKLVLVGVGVIAVLLAVTLRNDLFTLPPGELWQRVQKAPLFQGLTAPLRWFLEVLTAEQMWPDFVLALGRALLVDAALFGLVLLLDAQYLETSAAASERLYARLQRMRTAGSAAAAGPSRPGKKPRFTLPDLPWWRGTGPTAWRQLLTTARTARNLLIMIAVFLFLALRPIIFQDHPATPDEGNAYQYVVVGLVFGLVIFFIPLLPFDFRGDLDRMEVLKSLPLRSWQIAVGELIAPVLLVAALQILSLVAVQIFVGPLDWLLPAGVAFALPFDWLIFGVVNLLFLWFPTRMAQAGADFQLMGRQMLFMMALWLTVMLLSGVAFGVGTVVYFVANRNLPAGLGAGWLTLAGFAVGLTPLVAQAFRRFDVATDTPP